MQGKGDGARGVEEEISVLAVDLANDAVMLTCTKLCTQYHKVSQPWVCESASSRHYLDQTKARRQRIQELTRGTDAETFRKLHDHRHGHDGGEGHATEERCVRICPQAS